MRDEQGYIIEQHEDYEVKVYDDGSFLIEEYVEPLDADPEYIKFMEEKKAKEQEKIVMWQYCRNLNDINTAIITRDPDWEGLTDGSQIIGIVWDTIQGCYVVFWRVEMK